jgi:Ser/Thr protein kinase RdoA (MazF antagonist)
MAELVKELMPQEILEAYYPGGITHQDELPGGEINTTLLVTDTENRKTILQRLSGIYDVSMGEDYEVVVAHLTDEGWEMADALKTRDGIAYIPDSSGRLWRSFSYIESAPGSELEGDLEACAALGGLLGALHCSLATLDYQPKFAVPHSQDTDYYTGRLETVLAKIPGRANRELAAQMIALSSLEDAIDSQPSQLIHGDPRIGNCLFREGKPYTFIDWDGLKIASPLLDLGDLLQSTAGETITTKGNVSVAQLQPIIEAYCLKAELGTEKQAFTEKALAAARVIALNLGVRHLIDMVEDRYFKWDPARFKSRLEFNLFCAQRQHQVYEVLKASA